MHNSGDVLTAAAYTVLTDMQVPTLNWVNWVFHLGDDHLLTATMHALMSIDMGAFCLAHFMHTAWQLRC